LRDNTLVPKDHPVIALRGRLDSLEAQILVAQIAFAQLGLDQGVRELDEILAFVKAVMRAEVLVKPFPDDPLIGLDLDVLRDQSHHPRKVFGIGHFEVSAADGDAVVWLNWLRTQAREAELATYKAFAGPLRPSASHPGADRPCHNSSPVRRVHHLPPSKHPHAPRPQDPPGRPDLLRAMNRLSSALYVMVFRAKTGAYTPTP
jgi:ethanolamine utilization cobalamin adenosyltransferase